jgi:aryl-alcohol dehydrogenase-like predicted oxidoreductase
VGSWVWGPTIWSPLYSGLLTGKYNHGIPADSRMNLPGYEWLKDKAQSPEGRRQLEGVNKLAFAGEIGLPVHHMALLWCLAEQFLVPALKPNDIVVVDNLGSHKGKAVRAGRHTGIG